ncbi:MAG: hypothetical protein IGQ88_09575 [Gloeomargaritaceae cyanobacterium C42_A2020_066]|nr:hypothetical protein [Gloeomargaritaceae cyanobacterium C42_A2020_066]
MLMQERLSQNYQDWLNRLQHLQSEVDASPVCPGLLILELQALLEAVTSGRPDGVEADLQRLETELHRSLCLALAAAQQWQLTRAGPKAETRQRTVMTYLKQAAGYLAPMQALLIETPAKSPPAPECPP